MTKETLKTARKRLGISQFKLAKLARVSRYNIALHETDVRNLTKEETSKIHHALKKERMRNANRAR